jgi:ADP-ribosyl-[dinitrogen reductase] hydrolase
MTESSIAGCMLGTAVGDALGLPYEGLSRRRLKRLLGPPDRHRFMGNYGMVSDDTEHTCLVAQSLVASSFDLDRFVKDFAKRLRLWFVALPAGIGRATLRSCIKLWLGFSPKSSGVFSAGNGPAMRSAIFGAIFDDIDQIVSFVRASSHVTHTDPKAEFGAIAVALATWHGRRNSTVDGNQFVKILELAIGEAGAELTAILRDVVKSVASRESTLDYAAKNGHGSGVTGYTYHTVPVVIHAWLSNSHDYRRAVASVIECGGDADTTAAIVGGIVGATTGEEGIPKDWLAGICEWPRSVSWMRRLSKQLHEVSKSEIAQKPVTVNPVAILIRNPGFLVIVLLHGFRRLFPPY